jgi:hypothetical protein
MTVRTRRAVLNFMRSPDPTPYQVIDPAAGESLWVRCAMDALMYPLLTGHTVEIIARPPGGRGVFAAGDRSGGRRRLARGLGRYLP